nr:ATP-binding cassette transporter Abcg-like1-2 [Brachionus angularis]
MKNLVKILLKYFFIDLSFLKIFNFNQHYNNNKFYSYNQSSGQNTDYYSKYFNNQNNSDDINYSNPINLTWNINVYVKISKTLQKKIKDLIRSEDEYDENGYKIKHKEINGIVKPGQLCAIMGASGSGKTTLLNVLNFRNKGKLKIDGEVKINGQVADWDKITRYSGYVQQDDLFNGTLTVREHLTFVAMLKMGSKYTIEERHQRVDEVIQELNLIKAQYTIIGTGDVKKGISGGEKRRLAFASEIITNPSILFCDEPTSGLDSFMAQSLVESMEALALRGKTVICTIHQPSSQVFEKFDTLCLIAEGRLAYLGSSKQAEQYFSRLGYTVPKLYNPADFYIQTLAISTTDRENSLNRVQQITDAFYHSQEYANMIQDINLIESSPAFINDYQIPPEYNTGYLSQFYWLLWRQLKLDIRNPASTKVVLAQSIFIAVFLGLIFLRLDNNENGVQNRQGVIFIIIMQCNFGYIFGVVNTFPLDLAIVYRETKNRLYSITPYFLVKQIAELPKFIIIPFFLVTIIYWMSGIYDNVNVYLQISFTFVLCTQIAVSYGLLISAIAPDLDSALAMLVPIIMPFLIFAGFFFNNISSPDYFVWIKYTSWFYYTNELVNVFLWRKIKAIPCTTSNTNNICSASNCFDSGSDVLKAANFKESHIARDFIVMIALFTIIRLIAYIILKLKLRKN